MELVLNPKQVNTLRCYDLEEPIEFGGILNSVYKNDIKHSPRNPKSLFSVKRRMYSNQLRHTQSAEAIVKLAFFAAIIIGVIL